MSVDDSLRRIANQVFFEQLYVTDEGIEGEPGEPFNILFNRDVQRTAASRYGETAVQEDQTGNVAGLNNQLLVGDAGIEPTTSSV